MLYARYRRYPTPATSRPQERAVAPGHRYSVPYQPHESTSSSATGQDAASETRSLPRIYIRSRDQTDHDSPIEFDRTAVVLRESASEDEVP
ncbi:hypothetical protein CYV19_04080 [Natronobacterium gregoryi SP2]|uniref:Uncharacterized protein n=1 Tax=Natronobacterium gregoryi (strain ATCC 43098 / DSM 3393 / CCM 3738 / CIP 104747 / IAM 13177 / JCM 8860 / NBRC 102187 / NCIMB 2189 / SP2) TaxID=797304 RepID=L9YLK2_NATGS|nr:hypothetical protein C490_00405 [Natronobacterium gregoryi SP2]PLK21480.1 hypothetical protein CYV19_04080 [Natronobacterium gregoryi SP2]